MNLPAQKKILLAGLFHETHTFLSQKTGMDQFRETGINIGQDIISRNQGNGSPMDGFLSYAEENDWQIIPTIQMAASPSGTVTDEVYNYFTNHFFKILERECHSIDGVYLVLHGAMVCESYDDVEGTLLREIRKRLTAKGIDIPVVAVIDLHANVSYDMVEFSTCMYSYRKNPHSDAREAAVEAAKRLDVSMAQRVCISQHHLPTQYVVPPTGLSTAADPMKSVLKHARMLETKDPDLLCINVMGGYAYADITDCGFSLNCCTRGDEAVAKGYLDELLEVFEQHLADVYPIESSLDEALEHIDREKRPNGPVLLIEPADNIGGGTPGDGTGILGPLLIMRRKNIIAVINDPESAMRCNKAGVGSKIELMVGAKTDLHHGQPVPIKAEILHLSDGKFELENKQSHLASMMGSHIEMGPCAVIVNEQATILLTSLKIPPMDLGQLHSQGIYPKNGDLVIVKAAVSHKDAYDPIAAASYYVDSAGLCTSNLLSLPYKKLKGKQISAR
ncbi:MAG: M81 family metallopeptidase [Rhizobiales bacterium]|nr:M81 family metallopeptidase [Hyphomicrobiales bacterium]NRB14322.1 M81 family metallopeptidase [Hyphomicrobiales bacterium]